MRRRKFLTETGRAALGFSLLPQLARAQVDQGSLTTSEDASGEKLVADVQNLIPGLMEKYIVPGLSIAIVREGKLLWRRGFGFKDSASKDPVDDETIFEAASVSKTVFAYAVMKSCEKGVMDLDTPLTKYSPRPFLEGDPRLDLITARHVLSHTSGFQNWRSNEESLNIHFTPGEKFHYSGEGYYYLQSVLTHLTGRVDTKDCAKYEADFEVCATDIDAFMKRTLLEPFGMVSSGYIWNDRFEKHTASPHDSEGKSSAKKKPRATDAARYASAGGLHTTATDYAKFLIEIVNPKKSDAFRLEKKDLQEMLRPQVKLAEQEKIDGANSWALGWAIQERATGNVIVRSGGQSGFRSLAMASAERKSGFIILTNGDHGAKIIYDQALGNILNRLLVGTV